MRGFHNGIWLFKDSFGLFVYGQYMTLATALLNIGFSILLGLKWGIFGILLATAVSRLLTNIWYDPWMLFKHGFNRSVIPFYFESVGYFVLLIAVGLITYKVAGLVTVTGWISLFKKFLITLALPNVIYLLLFFKTKRFGYVLERLLSLFKKKGGSGI